MDQLIYINAPLKYYRISTTTNSFCCREDEFILTAMLRSRGGPIHHGCCGGGCGVCKMRVAGGEYEIAKRMSRAHVTEFEQRAGVVLLCCIKPRSDLVLEVAAPAEISGQPGVGIAL